MTVDLEFAKQFAKQLLQDADDFGLADPDISKKLRIAATTIGALIYDLQELKDGYQRQVEMEISKFKHPANFRVRSGTDGVELSRYPERNGAAIYQFPSKPTEELYSDEAGASSE